MQGRSWEALERRAAVEAVESELREEYRYQYDGKIMEFQPS